MKTSLFIISVSLSFPILIPRRVIVMAWQYVFFGAMREVLACFLFLFFSLFLISFQCLAFYFVDVSLHLETLVTKMAALCVVLFIVYLDDVINNDWSHIYNYAFLSRIPSPLLPRAK